MSKVSIGEDEYEDADLLAYQQFNLRLFELVLEVADDTNNNVVIELNRRIAKCYANMDWLRSIL